MTRCSSCFRCGAVFTFAILTLTRNPPGTGSWETTIQVAAAAARVHRAGIARLVVVQQPPADRRRSWDAARCAAESSPSTPCRHSSRPPGLARRGPGWRRNSPCPIAPSGRSSGDRDSSRPADYNPPAAAPRGPSGSIAPASGPLGDRCWTRCAQGKIPPSMLEVEIQAIDPRVDQPDHVLRTGRLRFAAVFLGIELSHQLRRLSVGERAVPELQAT